MALPPPPPRLCHLVKWEDFEGFRRFRDFVKKLTITNDPAEHGVGLVKEFIATFQNETSCQNFPPVGNIFIFTKSMKSIPLSPHNTFETQ